MGLFQMDVGGEGPQSLPPLPRSGGPTVSSGTALHRGGEGFGYFFQVLKWRLQRKRNDKGMGH